MKRMISILLAAIFVIAAAVPVIAAGEFALAYREYYRADVSVLYDGSRASHTVDFMMPSTPKTVYVNAEQLASVVGFKYAQSYNECSFVDSENEHVILFKFDSTDVAVYILGSLLNYKAPVKSEFIDGVAWVPLDFALTLFSCDLSIGNDMIIIDAPADTALTAFARIATTIKDYLFDYVDELGYDVYADSQSDAYHKLNFVDGLLTFEGRSWGMMLDSLISIVNPLALYFYGDEMFDSYTKAYVADVSELFITSSEFEAGECVSLMRTANDYIGLSNVFTDPAMKALDGKIGIDAADVKAVEKLALKDTKLISTYTRKADLLDKTVSGQKVFGTITSGLQGVAITANTAAWVLELCEYYSMFNGAEEFAADSLGYYGKVSDYGIGDEIDSFVRNYNSGNLGIFAQYVKDNATKIVGSYLPLPTVVGALVAGWSIARDKVPALKNSIDKANSFAIYEYSSLLMDDSYDYLTKAYDETFTSSSLNEDSLEELIYLTYAYLKFSYISRDAALGSVKGTGFYRANEPYMNEKNEEIAKYLDVFSKCGDSADYGQGYGFLPSHMSAYNRQRNDSALLEALNECSLEKIVASYQNSVPFDEFNPFPGGDDAITEEDAIMLCKTAMSQGMPWIFDLEFLKDVYTFEVVGYYKGENVGSCYVIELATYGSYEQTPFMVPVDGSSVYMGVPDGQGSYYVYSDIDLLNFSYMDLVFSIIKIAYKAYQGEDLEAIFAEMS